jgi:hypothetical protein
LSQPQIIVPYKTRQRRIALGVFAQSMQRWSGS